MKKITIIIMLFSATILYSQSYTEKYSSINDRYEYYDSSGNMISYKKWNSINKRWEYYDVKKKRTKTDYGEYVQPINFELVNKVLSSKQNSYDRNIALVSNHIAQLKANLFNYFSYDREKRSLAMEAWNETIQNVNSMNFNYSKSSVTRTVISSLNTLYYGYIDNIENPVKPVANYNNNNNNNSHYSTVTKVDPEPISRKYGNKYANNSAPRKYLYKCKLAHNLSADIKKRGSYSSETLFQVYNTNIIYVINEDKSYFKVYANGRYGYINKRELDKKNKL